MDPGFPGLAALLLVSLGPGILWVWFFYAKDVSEPEPKGLVAKAFLYGAISVLPAALIEAPFRRVIGTGSRDLLTLLAVSVLVVGLVEEAAKLVAVKLAAYDNREFDEVMDGIVYAVAAGLGFAATENLFYATSFGIAVGVVRAFVTDLAHASFSGIVGYHLGMAKFEPQRAVSLVARGMAAAVLLHGSYDFLIIGGMVPPAFGILMVLVTFGYLSRKIRQAQKSSSLRFRGRRQAPSERAGLAESPRRPDAASPAGDGTAHSAEREHTGPAAPRDK